MMTLKLIRKLFFNLFIEVNHQNALLTQMNQTILLQNNTTLDSESDQYIKLWPVLGSNIQARGSRAILRWFLFLTTAHLEALKDLVCLVQSIILHLV